jgi:8-oxo-dGTP pyrophosphatase MutT (NUDIX family)
MEVTPLNPWKTLEQKTVYENNWIEVQHHEVLNPSKEKGIYGKVLFKNIAIGIIPVDESYHTWLVGQFRYPLDTYSWEIPEGGGKLDTPPLDSAQRELSEETGITAENWKAIQEIHTSNSVSDEYGIIYLATGLTFAAANPDSNEELQVKRLPLKEALELVVSGEITDSLSIAGLFKLHHLHPEWFH